MEVSQVLVLNVLQRDFPDVAEKIMSKIRSSMPEMVLSDTDQVQTVINAYCKIRDIQFDTWSNKPGIKRITYERELLLTVMIMFFQPEKLNGLSDDVVRYGLIKELSKCMICSKNVISISISNCISNYRIYNDFRNESNEVYNQIKQMIYGN